MGLRDLFSGGDDRPRRLLPSDAPATLESFGLLNGPAPGGDAVAFCDALAERDVYVMPGTLFDRPEHFRISLTATIDMIERALPHLLDVSAGLGRAA